MNIYWRGIYKEGVVGADDWLTGTNTIDAKLITENFQSLYATLSGGLHQCNLAAPPGGSNRWGETVIQFPETMGLSDSDRSQGNFTRGMGHSHNGIDSAQLGRTAISRNSTKYKSYGSWMFPSGGATGASSYAGQLICHGTIEISYLPERSAAVFYVVGEIPYDRARYGNVYITDTISGLPQDSTAFVRLHAQARVTNPLLEGNVRKITAYRIEDVGFPYFGVYVGLGDIPQDLEDALSIDWMAVFMTKAHRYIA